MAAQVAPEAFAGAVARAVQQEVERMLETEIEAAANAAASKVRAVMADHGVGRMNATVSVRFV